jgi:prolyl 4-hydroxylase
MRRSTVVGSNGDSVVDSVRTSYGTFIPRYQTPIIGKIEERIATWTKLNVSNQEDIQILRYAHGQKYGAHYDQLVEDTPRVATVLVYLKDGVVGGETAFPESSEWVDPSIAERMGPFSECAQGFVAVKPKKGDALLFWSAKPDGSHDEMSLHTGCPVISGIKWTATFWIHSAPFRPEQLNKPISFTANLKPEECKDVEKLCPSWAAEGECKQNSAYMIGDDFSIGACRVSCNACEDCAPDDRECRSRNRVKSGYLSLDELDDA